jgi:indole-3-glycerol phosphate synthase
VNFLRDILEHTREEVGRRKRTVPLDELKRRPLYERTPSSLSAALRAKTPSVIAEIKKASPSRGVICGDFDPSRTARAYERGGASAISVLTEGKYFLGSLAHLEAVRHATELPLLRKDFILDAYQVHEAKSSGADAILLIAAALSADEIVLLRNESAALGLESLVEVHSRAELESIRECGFSLIGINNRDLVTFETDVALSAALAPALPEGAHAVSESGIRTGEDVRFLLKSGIRSFLVGEHFMRSEEPGKALGELLRSSETEQ